MPRNQSHGGLPIEDRTQLHPFLAGLREGQPLLERVHQLLPFLHAGGQSSAAAIRGRTRAALHRHEEPVARTMDGAACDAALPQMLQHLGPHFLVPSLVRRDQLGIILQVEGVVAEHGARERRSEGEKVRG